MTKTEIQYIQESVEEDPRMISLWVKLAGGRAYTLIELSGAAGYDRQETRRILEKAKKAGVIRTRGNRNRTYYFIQNGLPESVIAKPGWPKPPERISAPSGMRYCRHCYGHLAGYVGVKLSAALVKKGILVPDQEKLQYSVTKNGWDWFAKQEIYPEDFDANRPLTKTCLDFSERKNHLGGQLGDALLRKMLEKGWMSRVPGSREIKITREGRQKLEQSLDFDFGEYYQICSQKLLGER